MIFLDGKGVCLILIGKKIKSHYFLIESPDFFSWVSRFSFIRGWQVCVHCGQNWYKRTKDKLISYEYTYEAIAKDEFISLSCKYTRIPISRTFNFSPQTEPEAYNPKCRFDLDSDFQLEPMSFQYCHG